MVCPLCGQRKARRACPALNQQICAVCCGTKRLVEIACPRDCSYLAASREHPPAATVRRQRRDLEVFARHVRDLNERQSQLFVLVLTFISRYEPPELHPLIDADVIEAIVSLAATFETALRGVIYEHRPTSLPAERLVSALKPVLAEAGRGGGTAFDRDLAVVLRRIESAARDAGAHDAGNHRTFLEIMRRMMSKTDGQTGERPEPAPNSGLIVSG